MVRIVTLLVTLQYKMSNIGACFGQQAMITDSLNSDNVVNFIHIGGLHDESKVHIITNLVPRGYVDWRVRPFN